MKINFHLASPNLTVNRKVIISHGRIPFNIIMSRIFSVPALYTHLMDDAARADPKKNL